MSFVCVDGKPFLRVLVVGKKVNTSLKEGLDLWVAGRGQRAAPLRVLAFCTSEPPTAACSAEGVKGEKGREVTDMSYSSLAEQWTVLAQYGELVPSY